ncbi:MAG: HEAT repeat domain-containing protein [Saprospiraceae bacterium]|nr:HEAT repeat domain-containing protein [Saprospiraceae bacterium]
MGTQTFFVYPQRGLRDALTYWVEGGVYGKQTQAIGRDQLPLTGELMPVVTQYSRVAPCGLGLYRNTALGADFRNNLFSTQFNTHAVIRHQLIRDGGSFRTEDSPFLWSDHEDIHPTDVLEDGDGSLLVVETGGWFIKGCPLSQVSKPQVKGSIYRIRRDGAARTTDPFGNKMDWETLEMEALIDLLNDDRPFVSDRAIEELVNRGEEAVVSLSNQLSSTSAEAIRIRCVFALYRIGTPVALAGIRGTFNDASEGVRIAAARCVGLARDNASIDALIGELAKESDAARRQAATALGQIGSIKAVPHLLNAALNEDDRFVKHAIIHSLMLINQPQLILPGLDQDNRQVKEVALIALDQMRSSLLNFDHLVPFIESEDQHLQQTGLWVASHHPEWSAEMITYLQPKMLVQGQDEKTRSMVELILTAFCGNSDMQQFITKEFDRGDQSQKLFLLKIMSDCQAESFPAAWAENIKSTLASTKDVEIKSKLIDLIRFRRLHSLTDLLIKESENTANAPAIRIKAIAALLESNPVISPQHFDYLFDQLQSSADVQLRQQVASTLGNAQLTEKQLLKITQTYLPTADPFILPRLLPLFQQSQNLKIGQALISVLSVSSVLQHFTEDQIRVLFVNYPAEINGALEVLITKLNEARSDRLQRLTQLEEKIKDGDEARGRKLYFSTATCWTCHTILDEGGDLGPDLTSIQKDRSTHDILEAILYPSVSFVREYETYDITTQSAKYTGIIKEQSPEAIVLGVAPETTIRIKRDEIVKMELSEVSLMPQGLGEILTDEEMADLVSFLLGDDLNY